jgi:hypothetical protein
VRAQAGGRQQCQSAPSGTAQRNGRDTVALHRICHAAIHATLSEKELERQYNTIEPLREHPQLRRFIVWVRRKPPEFWVRTRCAR